MPETDEEKKARKAELAEAFADGLDIFEQRNAERKAKEEAAKGKETKSDDNASGGDETGKRSWAERLLG